jgi:uncharacterized protein
MRSNNIIILDSNIWISYLLGKQLHHLVVKSMETGIEFITCRELIEEIEGVLNREKFRKYVTKDDIAEFVAIHIKLCRMIKLKSVPEAFTDKKDNFLLALYETGKAATLVTGDKLLLKEAARKNVQVIHWHEFKQLLVS